MIAQAVPSTESAAIAVEVILPPSLRDRRGEKPSPHALYLFCCATVFGGDKLRQTTLVDENVCDLGL